MEMNSMIIDWLQALSRAQPTRLPAPVVSVSAPAHTAPTVAPHEATMELLSRGLTLMQQKNLMSAAAPQLSALDGTLPRRQDLSDFWEWIKRAVSGLGSSIDINHFDSSHIRARAPLILG